MGLRELGDSLHCGGGSAPVRARAVVVQAADRGGVGDSVGGLAVLKLCCSFLGVSLQNVCALIAEKVVREVSPEKAKQRDGDGETWLKGAVEKQ